MSADDLLLQFVGAPEEFVRAVDPKYADEARNDFALYVLRALSYNQSAGGRYNPSGEFGALYTASDERTAWAEVHARLRREGVPGLPPTMGLIRLTVTGGRSVDFEDADARAAWGADLAMLQADTLTDVQREACWQLGRDVRASADFMRAPSARASGANIPLFVGRPKTELTFDLAGADPNRATPSDLQVRPSESWDDPEF